MQCYLYNVILESGVCKNDAKLSGAIGTIGAIARMMPTNMAWYLQGRILGMNIAGDEAISLAWDLLMQEVCQG